MFSNNFEKNFQICNFFVKLRKNSNEMSTNTYKSINKFISIHLINTIFGLSSWNTISQGQRYFNYHAHSRAWCTLKLSTSLIFVPTGHSFKFFSSCALFLPTEISRAKSFIFSAITFRISVFIFFQSRLDVNLSGPCFL